jgi:hypothetical protein
LHSGMFETLRDPIVNMLQQTEQEPGRQPGLCTQVRMGSSDLYCMLISAWRKCMTSQQSVTGQGGHPGTPGAGI